MTAAQYGSRLHGTSDKFASIAETLSALLRPPADGMVWRENGRPSSSWFTIDKTDRFLWFRTAPSTPL
jgi:hypothetical protein